MNLAIKLFIVKLVLVAMFAKDCLTESLTPDKLSKLGSEKSHLWGSDEPEPEDDSEQPITISDEPQVNSIPPNNKLALLKNLIF